MNSAVFYESSIKNKTMNNNNIVIIFFEGRFSSFLSLSLSRYLALFVAFLNRRASHGTNDSDLGKFAIPFEKSCDYILL